MILNKKKIKNNKLYIIISVLLILVLLINSRDYIENNLNKEKYKNFEQFANNNNSGNNNKNTKIKKLEKKVEQLKQTNDDIRTLYLKLRATEEEGTIKELQKQTEIENEKELSARKKKDKQKIDKLNKKTTNHYLEYQKNKGTEVNFLNIGENIEDGIYKLSNAFDKNKKSLSDIFKGEFKSDTNVEGFINNNKRKEKTKMTTTDRRKKELIVSEEDTIIEEENQEEIKNIVNGQGDLKYLKEKFFYNNKKESENEKKKESELDEDLFSYFTYVFKNIYSLFKKYFDLYINKNKIFNLGDMSKDSNTLIGGGMLFIIISMGLYFIDISS